MQPWKCTFHFKNEVWAAFYLKSVPNNQFDNPIWKQGTIVMYSHRSWNHDRWCFRSCDLLYSILLDLWSFNPLKSRTMFTRVVKATEISIIKKIPCWLHLIVTDLAKENVDRVVKGWSWGRYSYKGKPEGGETARARSRGWQKSTSRGRKLLEQG